MSAEPAGLQRFNSYNRTTAPIIHGDKNADTTEVPEQQFNIVEREDVPPNGGYGWVCTACVFLMNAHTWGVNSVCISLGDTPFTDDARPGQFSCRIILKDQHSREQANLNMR